MCRSDGTFFRAPTNSLSRDNFLGFMNKRVILFHLKEAKEELDRTIEEIGKGGEYDVPEFRVAMSHLYHHLNTAWNGPDMAVDVSEERRQVEFELFRKFPSN